MDIEAAIKDDLVLLGALAAPGDVIAIDSTGPLSADASAEPEDVEYTVDEAEWQAYLVRMRALIPTISAPSPEPEERESFTPAPAQESGSSVSAAKRRKMDKKKLKRAEQKAVPSIVEFKLLPRRFGSISLLPPPVPQWTTENPAHRPVSSEEAEALRARIARRGVVVDAEELGMGGSVLGRTAGQILSTPASTSFISALPTLLITERTRPLSLFQQSLDRTARSLAPHASDPRGGTSCSVFKAVRFEDGTMRLSSRKSAPPAPKSSAPKGKETRADGRRRARIARRRDDSEWARRVSARRRARRRQARADGRASA